MDHKILAFVPNIYFPEVIFWGERSLLFLKTIQKKKKLIIASESFKKLNRDLFDKLFSKDMGAFIQNKEPTVNDFNKLNQACLKDKPDYLIAIGGGSVIDIAKLVKRDLGIKMVAIPTTIGSGAEVSQHALLIDRGNKKIYSSSDLLPEIVLVNPSYLKSLTQEQLVFQSIDALSHGLESLVSRLAQPLSESFSLQAIEKIFLNLNLLIEDGNKQELLVELQVASILASFAQSSVGTGLTHALAHFFGARNNIHHSKMVASFLLDVLELNLKHSNKYQKLDQLKSVSSNNILSQLANLFTRLDVKPEKIDIPEIKENLQKTAEMIKKDICTTTNPYSPTSEEIIEILKRHLHG